MKPKVTQLLACAIAAALVGLPAVASAATAPARPRDSIEQIERFWRKHFRQISEERFTRLRSLVFLARGEDPPDCGDVEIRARDLRGNALYCPKRDQIQFDFDGFGRQLLREHGPRATTIVLAHEYGHAIQQRLRTDLPSVIAELQADCYAGAFAGSTLRRRDDPDVVLARPLMALLGLSDPAGADPRRVSAHGTGFDRVAAFLDGVDQGVRRCRRYAKNPPKITTSRWTSPRDRERGGELDHSVIVGSFSRDLNAHYADVAAWLRKEWVSPPDPIEVTNLALCGASNGAAVWCGNDTVLVSSSDISQLERIGDVAAAAELGRAWAAGAQRRFPDVFMSDPSTTECLTGLWLGTMHPGAGQRKPGRVTLSPRDLDEVVEAVLVDDRRADKLGRLRALLDGFRIGLRECVRKDPQQPQPSDP
jgi:hypothetical protein